MKKHFCGLAAIIFAVIALLGLAPMAKAQGGLNVGAVFQIDSDRLEAAPGVSFGAGVYSARPPRQGFDSPDLIGLFSSTLGQYPVIYRGLWLKLTVFPGGFRRLEGVDYDPSGQLGKDERNGWESLLPEQGGGFSISIQAERLGALPLRFRVRHRDGRDRYTLLIFTLSWVRGGTLPTALEIMVQREPQERLSGEGALTYLRGFIPATATRSDAGVTQQKIEVPSQTATQTVHNGGEQQGQQTQTQFERADQPVDFATPVMSIWQSSLATSEIGNANGYTVAGTELISKATQRGRQDQMITSISVDSSRWKSFVLVLEDARPFKAELNRANRTPINVEVRPYQGKYRAVLYGSVTNLINATLNVIDAQGNLRTVTFTDHRPEGQ